MDPALHELLRTGNRHDVVPAIVRIDPREPLPATVQVVARFGDIATVRMRRGDVAEAYASDALCSVKAARFLMPEPLEDEADDEAARAALARIAPAMRLRPSDARRDPDWPSGEGTVVAALDWGLDFTHPEFRDADGRTRIDALWDQGTAYDPAFPNPYGYGRIYRRHEIDRALATEAPFSALGYDPRRADRGAGTHATHVLGIAAGSGAAGPGGIAPKASLVFVDLAPAGGHAGRRALTDSAAVLEALHFIDVEAAARPASINLSLGTHGGPHDGSALVEQGIDAFLAASPRRVVVQSTGNYFARHVHAGGRIAQGERAELPVIVDREDSTPNDIEAWYRGCDAFVAHVRAPDGRVLATAARGQIRPVLDGGVEIGRLYHRERDPNNRDHHVQLRLDAPAATGRWTLVLEGAQVEDGAFDAWIERDTQCAACQPTFPPGHAAAHSTTGSICNGHRSIAVGAFDAHQAHRPMARFSSSGPTRDGRAKPDLVAPGVRVLSARSTPRGMRAGGARLTRMSGTSMAAPHATGAAALLFDAGRGELDNARIRDLLRATARPDASLDATDRLRFGAGRLDVGAALAAARAALAARPSSHQESDMETTTPAGGCACADPARNATLAAQREDVPDAAVDASDTAFDEAVAVVESLDDASEDVEYVVRRRRSRGSGPIIAPVIGVGGLGAAVVAPMGGGLGVALPLGGSAPAVAPAASAPAATACAPCACAPAASDAPVAVASPDPLPASTPAVESDAEASTAGTWIVTERDAQQAADSWLAADAAHAPDAWPTEAAEAGETERAEHVDEYDEIAEQAVADAPLQGAARFVADLLARAGMPGIEAELDEYAELATRLPARLFDHFNGRRDALPASLAGRFELVAAPGMALPPLSAGDWLLRRGDGGYAHVAVLAAPGVWPASALHRSGFRTERALHGGYVHVIEPGPAASLRADRLARRVCDGARRVLADTLVLRPQRAAPRPRITLDELDEAVDTRWIQQALNRILGIELTVDGVLGPQSRAAIRSFQNREGLSPDGIVGPRTEAALQRALGNVSGTGVATHGTPPTRTGTQAPPPAADCTTLDDFDQGRDSLKPPHHTLLIGVARRIQRESIRLVDITGFASSEGDEAANLALGLRRANRVMAALRETLERMRPGSSAGVAMIPLSRGESDQIAGGSLAQNRRVLICPRRMPRPIPVEQPVRTRLFVVTGKSFIARIGSNIGSLDCGIPIPSITIPGIDISTPPVTIPGASNAGLRALAIATDIALDENPSDDRIFTAPPPESKGYRLFSQGRVQAMTRGTQLVNLSLDAAGLRTDTGKECLPGTSICLQAPPMRIDQPFSTQRLDASRIRFRWKVAGEPHRDAKRPFDAICERISTFIWHEIVGTVDASSGTPEISNIFIQGSRFPTHRLWVDNVVRGRVPQNEFSALWDGTPGEPTRVR